MVCLLVETTNPLGFKVLKTSQVAQALVFSYSSSRLGTLKDALLGD
jgi:hypothetical protein